MAVGEAHVYPGFLTSVLTQLFFPKLPTTFLACFCRGERRNYAEKKVRLNLESNSQPPGHESDTLTTEPPGRGSRTGLHYDNLIVKELFCYGSITWLVSWITALGLICRSVTHNNLTVFQNERVLDWSKCKAFTYVKQRLKIRNLPLGEKK